jgi:hypothetical protein
MPLDNKDPVRYGELTAPVLAEAARAAFKTDFVEGYRVTDIIPMEKRERGDIGRGDFLIRMARDFYADTRPPRKYGFFYIDADEAFNLIALLEKLPPAERGDLYDRLIADFKKD